MAKKKVTIERKPMKVKRTRKISEEQREALRERMKEMRKKRKPAEYKNINERVIALPDDDTYSFKNIKGWMSYFISLSIKGLVFYFKNIGCFEENIRR